ncbi:MAG: hypothetical protein O2816_11475 [Planctomycetota bacterium]|nr:hypothetical protein [Planctomycetota bacterium]
MKKFTLPLFGLLLITSCKSAKDKDYGLLDLSASVGFGAVSFDTSTDGAVEFNGAVDEKDTSLQLGLSAKVHPQVSLDLAYVDLGTFTWDGTWMGTPDNGSIDTTGVRLGATGSFPVKETDWSWVATGGLFFWDQDGQEIFGGVPEPAFSKSGSDLYLGGGVQYQFTDVLGARLTLTRTFGVNGDDVDALMLDLLYSFR